MSWWDRLLGRSEKYDISISDPAFAALLQMGTTGLGVYSTYEALRNPAFFRGVSLISGTIASLPLKTYRNRKTGVDEDGDAIFEREESSSFLTTAPSGPYGLSPFTWREMLAAHLVTAGEVGMMHVHNNGGGLIGLWPTAPTSYEVRWNGAHKIFTVRDGSGKEQDYGDSCDNAIDGRCFTQVMAMTLDGRRGLSPVVLFRRNIELAHAQEVAAMRTMTNGMLQSGLITAEEDISEDDAKTITAQLRDSMLGPEKAGGLAWINRKLKLTPWQQNNTDAQFLQGREFSVLDVARMLGVPAHRLMANEKTTSWGTGLIEENVALARYTLMPYTSRLEEACSGLLSQPKFVEFDYKGLLQGSPAEEINLLMAQTGRPIMTVNEARAIRNMPPIDGGDELPTAAPPPPPAPPVDKKIPGSGPVA